MALHGARSVAGMDASIAAAPAPMAQAAPTAGRSKFAVAGPIACACAAAAAATYVRIADPLANGRGLIPCPLHTATGLWCPGCGLTRATIALMHGEIGTAFGYNLLFPFFFAAFALSWISWLRLSLGKRVAPWTARLPKSFPIATAAILLLFGVLRNLPGLQALAP